MKSMYVIKLIILYVMLQTIVILQGNTLEQSLKNLNVELTGFEKKNSSPSQYSCNIKKRVINAEKTKDNI